MQTRTVFFHIFLCIWVQFALPEQPARCVRFIWMCVCLYFIFISYFIRLSACVRWPHIVLYICYCSSVQAYISWLPVGMLDLLNTNSMWCFMGRWLFSNNKRLAPSWTSTALATGGQRLIILIMPSINWIWKRRGSLRVTHQAWRIWKKTAVTAFTSGPAKCRIQFQANENWYFPICKNIDIFPHQTCAMLEFRLSVNQRFCVIHILDVGQFACYTNKKYVVSNRWWIIVDYFFFFSIFRDIVE